MEVSIKHEVNGTMEEGIVKFRKVTWGRRNEALREATKTIVDPETNKPTQVLDEYMFKELLLLKSIESAPFPLSLDSLRNLDMSEGDKLIQALEKSMNLETTEAKK